jgi:hypothetical protein
MAQPVSPQFAPEEAVPADVLEVMANTGGIKSVGSLNHPHNCVECSFHFFSGKTGCRSGASCRFCHEYHPRKNAKKNRRLMRRFPELCADGSMPEGSNPPLEGGEYAASGDSQHSTPPLQAGKKIPKARCCPRCNSSVPKDAKFCVACGEIQAPQLYEIDASVGDEDEAEEDVAGADTAAGEVKPAMPMPMAPGKIVEEPRAAQETKAEDDAKDGETVSISYGGDKVGTNVLAQGIKCRLTVDLNCSTSEVLESLKSSLTFMAEPPLPAGLSLDKASGEISGTPLEAGEMSTHVMSVRTKAMGPGGILLGEITLATCMFRCCIIDLQNFVLRSGSLHQDAAKGGSAQGSQLMLVVESKDDAPNGPTRS